MKKSTSCSIAVIHSDNSISQIYCAEDGDLEHAGKTLIENYNTQELVEALIKQGDLLILGANLNPVSKAHSYDNPEPYTCVFSINLAIWYVGIVDFLNNRLDHDYNYIFKHGEWFVSFDSSQTLIRLTKFICDDSDVISLIDLYNL
jgi:hypothetical protein